MDDGTYNKGYYSFSTANFTLQEHQQIVASLNKTFDITANIYETKYNYLYIPAANDSNLKFFNLVKPFIVPSMNYKIDRGQ